MNINLFFPKVFHLVRDTFNTSRIDVNKFYIHYLEVKIAILVLFIVVVFGMLVTIFHLKRALLGSCIGVVATAIFLIFATVSRIKDAKIIADINNGFPIAQTSFQVRPNKIATGENLYVYLCENQKEKSSTTNNYQIYARVYNNTSTYQTYLFGIMQNGHFSANTCDPSRQAKIATADMLTALNSYATYIKKHHLENDFKNNAKLAFSNKYLDRYYHPTLVMKGKNNQILHIKMQSKRIIKEVVLTKSK